MACFTRHVWRVGAQVLDLERPFAYGGCVGKEHQILAPVVIHNGGRDRCACQWSGITFPVGAAFGEIVCQNNDQPSSIRLSADPVKVTKYES